MAAGFHPRGGCISVSDEGIKCSKTLREERRTVQKSCVVHAVLAQFLDAFNVDFLVDPYISGMVQDMFICCGLEPLHIRKRNKYDFKRDLRKRQKTNAILSLRWPLPSCTNKANAIWWQNKTEFFSQSEEITFAETYHNTNLPLASKSQTSSRSAHCLVGTDIWPFLLKCGKKCTIPSQEKLLSDKWHCILLLLFMSSSFSYMWRVILAFWCAMPLKTIATLVWLNCPQLIASGNAPQLILQEALAQGPWAAL